MAGTYVIRRMQTTFHTLPPEGETDMSAYTTVTYQEVTWDHLRAMRNEELKDTDWWALKDLTMSQAKKDYRTFLRDMPSTYSTANEAADAWSAYEIPE